MESVLGSFPRILLAGLSLFRHNLSKLERSSLPSRFAKARVGGELVFFLFQMVHAGYVYFLSKFTEFIDTVS